MSILVLSVSHKTAPVDLLSRASMDAVTSTCLEQSLADGEHISEAGRHLDVGFTAVESLHGELEVVALGTDPDRRGALRDAFGHLGAGERLEQLVGSDVLA